MENNHIDNYKVVHIQASELYKNNIKPWESQRTLNWDRVEDLKKTFIYNYETRGNLCIRSPILICEFQGFLHIVDGQHRYKAIENLLAANIIPKHTMIWVGIVNCQNKKDLMFEFTNANNVTKMELCFLQPDELLNDAMRKLSMKYPNIKEFDKRYRRPNFNLNTLKSYLTKHNFIQRYDIEEPEQITKMFDKLQDYYKEQDLNFFLNRIRTRTSSKTLKNFKRGMKDNYHRLGYFGKSDVNLIITDLVYVNNLLKFR